MQRRQENKRENKTDSHVSRREPVPLAISSPAIFQIVFFAMFASLRETAFALLSSQ
jgi:hypothetical protein